jgi:hypothetical protein
LLHEKHVDTRGDAGNVELNATLHVCESSLQDVTNRSSFMSNVVFQFLYGAWLVGISFSFKAAFFKLWSSGSALVVLGLTFYEINYPAYMYRCTIIKYS